MRKRSGQDGNIEKKGGAYYVRFWLDVEGQDKRVRKSVKICPATNAGSLTKSERKRRAREIIAESGANSEPRFKEVQAKNLGTTFSQQAEWWLYHMQHRKRRPIKPKTAASWTDCLRKWLNPNIGEMPLADVNNLAVKGLVSKMATAGLKPKSIQTYLQVVKMVVASSVDEEGEQRFPRKWNHDFIDLPLVKEQNTPSFTGREVCRLIGHSQGLYRALFMLLAGTGLRIGEALGLATEHIAKDQRSINIRQSVWNGRIQSPKTPSSVRTVDLCPLLAAELRAFIGNRTGFLFSTKSGRPVSVNNVLNRHLNPTLEKLHIGRRGFHAFRRFRTTLLRKKRVPEDLIRFWLGHADKTVTDGYSMVREEEEFRREWAEKIGLGFGWVRVNNGNAVAVLDPNGPKITITGIPVRV